MRPTVRAQSTGAGKPPPLALRTMVRRGEEEGLSCSPSKAAVQARLAGKPQLAPVSFSGTPPGAVVQEACGIWVLVVVWLGGVTLTIIYILSHPSVKVM